MNRSALVLASSFLLFAGASLPAQEATPAPSPSPSAPAALPFPNADFEAGLDGWTLGKDDETAGISQVSAEAAHEGKAGLRVKQAADGPGSWLESPRLAVEGGKRYRIAYWARCVEESGVGLWIQFFDGDKKPIKPETPGDFISLVPPDAREWHPYTFTVTVPKEAAFLSLAIHAFNKRPTVADFDDFSVAPF
ncbi:Carbohydrate binding domain-containing protein [Verrucomicrobium sp. GAS474]|uniref:carbohydrate binding domain-containing protein n=1 Tax=Verrucomicrobium sp. GAS474 TaxID=1882831 RepID=UPI00087AD957|nr:carbohydrate binding domain-containing protein [Verrucomicrobium sp. GAS474]SDT88741.1 Carbohydrate binding domain-containing protein [Verrucomicrobium sp. GAS474]